MTDWPEVFLKTLDAMGPWVVGNVETNKEEKRLETCAEDQETFDGFENNYTRVLLACQYVFSGKQSLPINPLEDKTNFIHDASSKRLVLFLGTLSINSIGIKPCLDAGNIEGAWL